jgi:hypothetical protein
VWPLQWFHALLVCLWLLGQHLLGWQPALATPRLPQAAPLLRRRWASLRRRRPRP